MKNDIQPVLARIYIIPVKMQKGGWKLAVVSALGSDEVLKGF